MLLMALCRTCFRCGFDAGEEGVRSVCFLNTFCTVCFFGVSHAVFSSLFRVLLSGSVCIPSLRPKPQQRSRYSINKSARCLSS